jgi:hypothetical protein
MRPESLPGGPETAYDPRLAAAERLRHRRHGWNAAAIWGILGFLLLFGASLNAGMQGTPVPAWFLVIVYAPGVLFVIAVTCYVIDGRRLARLPAGLRDRAAVTVPRRVRGHAHRYPPKHWVPWAVAWLGMLLILVAAVVVVPSLVDGIGYLTGADHTATFVPQAYEQSCGRSGCTNMTTGVLVSGGTRTAATWPAQVPLGQPFAVREPLWDWGVGRELISNDTNAAVIAGLSLLIFGGGVFVLISFARLTRNWLRHRRRGFATGAG